jgi:hypothetical protein
MNLSMWHVLVHTRDLYQLNCCCCAYQRLQNKRTWAMVGGRSKDAGWSPATNMAGSSSGRQPASSQHRSASTTAKRACRDDGRWLSGTFAFGLCSVSYCGGSLVWSVWQRGHASERGCATSGFYQLQWHTHQ